MKKLQEVGSLVLANKSKKLIEMSKHDQKHKQQDQEEQEVDDIEEIEEEESTDELEELKKQYQELENSYKRALADYQNLEKRVRDDKSNWIKAANKELITRLLPVLDTLLLAEKHTDDQGIKMTAQQFINTLAEEGAKRIQTAREKFDPTMMEAVEIVEGSDNIVVEEVRAGFMMSGQVIRPAQVKVGKKTE